MKHKVLWSVLGLFVAVLITVMYLLLSSSVLQWVYARVSTYVPGELTVDALDGNLLGPVTAKNIRYRYQNTEVDIQDMRIDWHILRILFGTLSISELQISDVDIVHTQAAKESKKTIDLPQIVLPLKIIISNSKVERLTVAKKGVKPYVLLDKIELEASLSQVKTQIERLFVLSPTLEATASGYIKPYGDYNTNFTIDWVLRLPEKTALAGQSSLSGTHKALHFKQKLTSPTTVSVNGVLNNISTKPLWQAQFVLDNFNPKLIDNTWPDTRIDGKGQASGSLEDLISSGDLVLAYKELGKIDTHFEIQAKDKLWHIEKLVFKPKHENAKLSFRGKIDMAQPVLGFDIYGNWQKLAWPLTKTRYVFSPNGAMHLRGKPDKYTLNLNATVQGDNIPVGIWNASAYGNRKQLQFNKIDAKLLDGELQAEALVAWQPFLRWRATIKGNTMNPGVLWANWPGKLDLAIKSQGEIRRGHVSANIELEHAKGTLRAYPLRTHAALTIDGDHYQLNDLELRSGNAKITATGSTNQTLQLQWNIRAPDIAALLPNSNGNFISTGAISGTRDKPKISANIIANSLIIDKLRVAELNSDIAIDMTQDTSSRLNIKANGIRLDSYKINALQVLGLGDSKQFDITASIANEAKSVDLKTSISHKSGDIQGQLLQANINTSHAGNWRLESPGALSIDTQRAKFGQWCWIDNGAKFCGTANWNVNSGWQAMFSAEKMPLAVLQPFLPSDIETDGKVDGILNAHLKDAKPVMLDANLSLSSGAIRYTATDNSQRVINYDRGDIQLKLDNKSFQGKIIANFSDNDKFDATFKFPSADILSFSNNQPIKVNLIIDTDELGIVSAFSPSIDETIGKLNVNLSLDGTLARPRIQGFARLQDVSMHIVDLNIRLKDLNIELTGSNSNIVRVDAKTKSGNGTLNINGQIKATASEGWPMELNITGKDAEAIKIPEAWVTISPNLAMQYRGRRIDLEGEISIPEAMLKPRPLPEGIALSKDVVIVDKVMDPEHQERWDIYTNIKLMLGDKVSFDGFGLSGQLSGDVLAVDAPRKITTGTGRLTINNGKYKTYGQTLEVERGQLLFTGGPIDDPGLDARASRRIDEVVAGVKVRGTLKSPELTLFSDPSMPNSDALSYLLLGRPVDQASSAEGELLLAAANTLYSPGGESLSDQIAARFGLEKIGLETGATSEDSMALILGTYLSPRLYVTYTIGLIEAENVFRARYQLNKKWLLQGDSSASSSGGDVLYTIEP